MRALTDLVRAHREEEHQGRRANVLELNGPIVVRVIATGRKPCAHCGGVFVWEMEAGPTGASFGDSYLHATECPTLFCKHGIRWAAYCADCDAEPQADEDGE